jgi:hypothetical protein
MTERSERIEGTVAALRDVLARDAAEKRRGEDLSAA